MIQSYADYEYYLKCDKVALNKTYARPHWLGDEVWKYERLLRKAEYFANCHSKNPLRYWYKYRLKKLGLKLGFCIPLNVVGPGLSLAHPGPVLINGACRIGKNCRIQTCVTLGSTNGSSKAPLLGDNIFLGDGCKIIGEVQIADNVAIGANAVVVKSITEPNTTWGGVPARKISQHSSGENVIKATELVSAKENNQYEN